MTSRQVPGDIRRWTKGLLVLFATAGLADASAAQTLEASGDPSILVISTASAGYSPDPVQDASTTYDLLDAQDGERIVGRLDAPLPEGVTLEVTLEPPAGAVGHGPVSLTTEDQDLVTLIDAGSYSGLSIQYDFSAGVDAGVVSATGRLVTYTLDSP